MNQLSLLVILIIGYGKNMKYQLKITNFPFILHPKPHLRDEWYLNALNTRYITWVFKPDKLKQRNNLLKYLD